MNIKEWIESATRRIVPFWEVADRGNAKSDHIYKLWFHEN